MFEKEIKVIYDFSINEVRQLGSFFTYEELTSVDLHPAVLKYISAELDYLIYEDRYRLLSNSNFDYSGNRIAEYFSLIGEEIKRSKRFAFEYADNLILQAISFNVKFLAQPNWALTKLIFEKENVIKTAELRQIINYIYFNDYIKTIVEKYLQKKNLQIISRLEFETILDKIDQELLASDPTKVFNLVLNSIGEFFNIGSLLKSKIPLYPFKLFLKEKKLPGYVAKLENAFRADVKQSYDIIEVQNVLFQPETKAKEQKPTVQKPAEQKPELQKPELKKPEVQKPEVQNRENYLDRIVKQETPASFFSSAKADTEDVPNEKDNAEVEVPGIKTAENEEVPAIVENSDAATDIQPEEDSVVMEFSEEEKTFDDLVEFETVEEPETVGKTETVEETDTALTDNAAKDNETDKKEDIFGGINVDNIDIDIEIADTDELKDNSNGMEGRNSGFLSKFMRRGNSTGGSKKTEKVEINDQADINDLKSVIKFSDETGSGENINPGQVKETENIKANVDFPKDDFPGENAFSRIFTVISEVFSKREQQKIISEIFGNSPEKFAGTVYDVITEAHNSAEAERLMDSVLRSNDIDPSSRWAKVFKKNTLKYFNQD